MPIPKIEKICTKCGEVLPASHFVKDPSKKDGLYSSCKECYRKRLGYKKHPDSWGKWHKDSVGYIALSRKRQHRVVMEKILGRELSSNEHVHHKNGDKTDNRVENLELIGASEHHREHYKNILIGKDGRFIRKL